MSFTVPESIKTLAMRSWRGEGQGRTRKAYAHRLTLLSLLLGSQRLDNDMISMGSNPSAEMGVARRKPNVRRLMYGNMMTKIAAQEKGKRRKENEGARGLMGLARH